MKKLTLILLLLLAVMVQLSSSKDIYHQRGIEIRGGMSLYMMMDDPNDWAQQFGAVSEKMENAPGFGLSILYKSHRHFIWNIGYNHHFATSTTFSNGNYEEIMDASEIFVVPSFILFPDERLSFSIGAGATLVMATLDRNSPMAGNLGEFYGAKGRNVGFLALGNLEFVFMPNLSLNIGGGVRSAIINDISFIQSVSETDYKYQVMWTDSGGNLSDRPYELDFTGVFLDFALRWYFEPKSKF